MPSMYALVHHALWNEEPTFAECHQVPELLNRIADLKKKGLTAERVAFSFMKWRVQPLMKWEHLRYEYIGAEDELRLSQEELSNDEIVLRLQKIFQGLTGIPAVAVREFSADNPPK